MTTEPQIGEQRDGELLGHAGGYYTYARCATCKQARWTQTPDRPCKKCADKTRSAWKLLPGREHIVVNRHVKYKDSCPECGAELWRHKEYLGHLCNPCASLVAGALHRREKNGNWAGGRAINRYGYVEVVISRDDPFFSMARKNKNVILEHRLAVARLLGRCLETWEVVHHKGVRYPQGSPENKLDNLPDNLELVIQAKNAAYARMTTTVSKLEGRISDLETQIRLLKWQVKVLQHGNVEPIPANEQMESSRAGVETRREEVQPISANSAPHPIEGDDIVQST